MGLKRGVSISIMERRDRNKNFVDVKFDEPGIEEGFYYTSGKKETKKVSLKDFEIGKSKSEGAFATVHEAVDKKYRKKYAIKYLNKNRVYDSLILKQPFIERKILLTTKDDNVIKMYHCFSDELYFYFILEYPDCTLNEYYKTSKDPRSIIRHFLEIINALEYFRSLNIVHRDIKPENILINSEGHIKIIDFGTAKFLNTGADPRQPHKGDKHTYAGTIAYMSPEVIDGKESRSTDADLWGLGCTLYTIASGRLPFEGGSEKEITEAIRRGNPYYPEELPKELVDLLQRLIVVEPDKRIGSKSFDEIRNHAFFRDQSIARNLPIRQKKESKDTKRTKRDPKEKKRAS